MGVAPLGGILAIWGISLLWTAAASPWSLLERSSVACSSILVSSDDTCASLASRCGITTAELSKFNTDLECSSSLLNGQPVCCSAGTLNLPPQPSSDGLCYNHTVQSDDTCTRLAKGYKITTEEIEKYNNKTFGWTGCKGIFPGDFICLSSGSPPMPVAHAQAICGPQVPGTTRPTNMSDVASLNPCIAKNCKCDLLGGGCYNTVDLVKGCPTGSADSSTSRKATKTGAKTIATQLGESSTAKDELTRSTVTARSTSKPRTTSSTHPNVSHSTTIRSKATRSTAKATRSRVTRSKVAHSTARHLSVTPSTSRHSTSRHSTSSHTTSTHSTSTQTTTSKTTKTEPSTSTATDDYWTIQVYAKENCKGDFYTLEGRNTGSSTTCTDLRGTMSTDQSASNWCRWVSSSDAMYTDCASSPLQMPGSWTFTNAVCSVYDTNNCTDPDDKVQSYTSVMAVQCQSLKNSAINFPVMKWNSLRCKTVQEAYHE
ncbi:glycoside hydrolase family 18 protein [Penicillium hispanicum]|uniref:glycoside hydrolase family 18 protein n=1 Tax=Penicillium hispanicum TaxID=1080232 RepID=UPI0025402EA8|nr:glycoside hydrolase family 18 protein [Penicillium hispanicum]KAJ5586765.1 glycoside hydrolase family 18 protein [Penicillium hispanicum]